MSNHGEMKGDIRMDEKVDDFSMKDDSDLTWLASQAAEDDHNLTLLQGLRKYPKACFWSIAVSSAIIMEGPHQLRSFYSIQS